MLDTQPSARYDGKYPPKSFVVAVSCFFTATATPAIYTLSLHDALPILNEVAAACKERGLWPFTHFNRVHVVPPCTVRSEEHTSELQSHVNLVCRLLLEKKKARDGSRARNVVLGVIHEGDHVRPVRLGAAHIIHARYTAVGEIRREVPAEILRRRGQLFFYSDGDPRDLHSFPTRRSSDLERGGGGLQGAGAVAVHPLQPRACGAAVHG